MSKFVKKPVVIEATMWFKNGDHPHDNCEMVYPEKGETTQFEPFLGEGKVVRRFCRPDVPSENKCAYCDYLMHVHGWIDTVQGGHTVCPGDWIITDDRVKDERGHGHYYPCKPDVFRQTYEKVDG